MQACSPAIRVDPTARPSLSEGPAGTPMTASEKAIALAGGESSSAIPTSTPAASRRPAASPRPSTASPRKTSAPAPVIATPAGTTVYVHYYLWWTPRHWQEKLGSGYPYTAGLPPAPGAMNAAGCNPTVRYRGATIIDVPAEGLYDQGRGATFDLHIAQAASARITGFIVSWQGTGQPGQAPSSSGYNSRLELFASRVNAYNASHGTRFRLALGLEVFGNYARPASQIINDLEYFRSRYAANPAFRNPYSPEPIVMLLASRQYSLSTVRAVSAAERSHFLMLGDETTGSWSRDAAFLDGASWYWSSQDPWNNPQSGSQVASLAAQVRAAGKAWFAPFTSGFNTQLMGGTTCVARRVSTLDAVWRMNRLSHPQGWFGISWNEFVENTYLEPSRIYGRTYLNELSRLIASG